MSAEQRMAEATDMELHRHLLKFFKFYGEDFNSRDNFLSIRKGGFVA